VTSVTREVQQADAANLSRTNATAPARGETMREREGLIARIRQIRRTADASATTRRKVAPEDDTIAPQALQVRIEHLEQLVQALQDSVHRESERQSEQITQLEARLEPAALSVALSKDARERGL
jgi:hypothetical protein